MNVSFLAEVIAAASLSAGGVLVLIPNGGDGAHSSPSPTSASPSRLSPPAEPGRDGVWVRLLGVPHVTVDGRRLPLRPRQVELVAFLALHRGGATESAIRTGLWWDRPVSRGGFNNLISSTRRQLGTYGDEVLLPGPAGDSRYRLAPVVCCDLELLQRNDVRVFDVVQGPPFDTAGFGWADRDGHIAWASTKLAALAHRSINAALEAGEMGRPLRWLDAALRAVPDDEQLLADRIRVLVDSGDLAAARRFAATAVHGRRVGELIADRPVPLEPLRTTPRL